MPSSDTDRLLHLLDGTLSEAERVRLHKRLAATPALRAELNELRATRLLLQQTVQDTTDRVARPFLADRVMRRLDQARRAAQVTAEEELVRVLTRFFRPVALASLLIVLGLATYNVTLASEFEAEQGALETVLALPPVTLDVAYEAGWPY